MKLSDQEYKRKQLAFWSLEHVESPLIGFTIGKGVDSWSYWQYNKATSKLFLKKQIMAEDIDTNTFVKDQKSYLYNSNQVDDDIYRTTMPLASIPWMEAILGCPIISSGENLKADKFINNPAELQKINFSRENPWVKKYCEFIEVYERSLNGQFPVGQSVLRGPADLACALLGAEEATIALLVHPNEMKELLEYVTDHLEQFLRYQLSILPKFKNGYVVGQYEVWAPEPVIRIQEDFSTLYSPELYQEFLRPLDKKLAGISPYSLIHLHSTSLFLIEHFLSISEIRAFQVTKDPGEVKLLSMIPALQKIQANNRPLIIKRQFDKEDIGLLKANLSVNGLCVQPVVRSLEEANELLPLLRKWE